MEELLKMPNRIFTFEGEAYKFKSLEDGELELVSVTTKESLTAQIDDGEVFIYLDGEMRSLEKVFEHYK